MQVAVTGSTGFIGRALVQTLQAAGHEPVRILRTSTAPATAGNTTADTTSADTATSHPTGSHQGSHQKSSDPVSRDPVKPVAVLHWNPETGEIEGDRLEEVDAVVHLAGEGIARRRWSEAQKRLIAESRIRGTRLLSETLATLPGLRLLISASAIGIYGNRGDELLDETSTAGDDFLARVCQGWEAAADPARAAGIRVVHPRTGIVLSPSGGALARMLRVFRLGLGGTIAGGSQWMSWISISDEVAALLYLLSADVEGPVNLTAPEPVTNRDFTKTLGRVLGRPTLLPAPKLALRAGLGRELADALLYSSARVEPAALMAHGFSFSHGRLGDCLEDLLSR